MTRATAAHRRERRLDVAVDAGVAWLRLHWGPGPDRIDLPLAQALCAAVDDLESDESIRVVVLGAAGARFCGGVEDGGVWQRRFDFVEAVGGLTAPVVAVIQGDAVAEGCELALACDLRVAATKARFALPQLQHGDLPSHGATQRLPRMVGRTRALDLLLTGRRLTAREACDWGLVSQVVPGPQLGRTVRRLATDLSRKGPLALRYAKEAVVKGSEMTMEQGIRLEEDLYVLLQTTADRHEGVAAFLDKRQPSFTGK